MKILAITFEAPSKRSGGGIGIIQSIESLKACGHVDYIGPEFEDNLFNSDDFTVVGYLQYSRKLVDRCRSLMDGVTNGYYQSWKALEKKIRWKEYDIVSLEFSRYPFVLEMAKKFNVPTILRVHNVERDYFENLYNTTKHISRKLQSLYYAWQEKRCIELCDIALTITKEDCDRLLVLYGKKYKKKIAVNPICILDTGIKVSSHVHNVLITGSLWYGPNSEGVVWFLENIWKRFDERGIKLQIAGFNPNNNIRSLARKYKNVELIDSPIDITPYFQTAGYYIAPVFNGAGMKVKVAEAMMYGLPIFATKHALIGYQRNEAIVEFVSDEDLIQKLEKAFLWSDGERESLQLLQRADFLNNYSMQKSVDNYKQLLGSILRGKE